MRQLTPRSENDEPTDALLLDARGVAALLSVSPKTVTRLAAAGELPTPIKLGRLTRWDRRAIEAWIAARQKETSGVDRDANGRR